MKVKLNSILIGVSDIVKAKPFYEKVFGVEFTEVRPPFSCFTMSGIEFNIEEIYFYTSSVPGNILFKLSTINMVNYCIFNM